MGTSCYIVLEKEKRKYRIYRHYDGYPEGVVPDIYILRHFLGDPEYFLANFIFYAKLSFLVRDLAESKTDFRFWEGMYGVSSSSPETVVEYEYTIRLKRAVSTDELPLTIREPAVMGNEIKGGEVIFRGTLGEAYEKYGKDFPDGCHINRELVEGDIKEIFAKIPVEALVNALDK